MMKKLTNVSPFLLLLVPVFVVMLIAFTTNGNIAGNEDNLAKANTSANSSTIAKAANVILK
ncbi:hypothetical protein [Pedobacter sp.]